MVFLLKEFEQLQQEKRGGMRAGTQDRLWGSIASAAIWTWLLTVQLPPAAKYAACLPPLLTFLLAARWYLLTKAIHFIAAYVRDVECRLAPGMGWQNYRLKHGEERHNKWWFRLDGGTWVAILGINTYIAYLVLTGSMPLK